MTAVAVAIAILLKWKLRQTPAIRGIEIFLLHQPEQPIDYCEYSLWI